MYVPTEEKINAVMIGRKEGVYKRLIYRLGEIKDQIKAKEILKANRNIDLLVEHLLAVENKKRGKKKAR